MATYKGINGFAVQSVATDPSPLDEGQVWYNNATYAFKLASVTTAGTWASGGALGTGRYSLGGFGLQTAAVAVGGYNVVPVTNLTNTENYDGTAWTASGSLTTGRRYLSGIGFGTQTAGAIYGGVTNTTLPQTYTNATEEYDGSTWTSGGTLNTAKGNASNAGTQTAAIAFGGSDKTPGTGSVALTGTESYNGTSWTNTPSTVITRSSVAGFGTQTAALCVTGNNDVGGNQATNATESWNGSSWTTIPATVNNARNGSSGVGIQTAGLIFGGYTPSNGNWAATESYNGSSWTSVNSLNTARRGGGAAGIQTAALFFAGDDSLTATESWNGTSWTTVNSLNIPKSSPGGAGSQTAALSFGGNSNGSVTGATELWNGTSWTNNPTGLGTARSSMATGLGTPAAALSAGGYSTDVTTATEEWTGQALATRTVTVS